MKNDIAFNYWDDHSIERYVKYLESGGFVKVLEIPFFGWEYDKKAFVRPERQLVFWHTDGLLLSCDTYNTNGLNAADVWYNWKPREGIWSGKHDARENVLYNIEFTSTGGYSKEGIWSGKHDARENVLYNIDALRKNGKFLNPWKVAPFIWLLNHKDHKDMENKDLPQSINYVKINWERIQMLPEEVQKGIWVAEKDQTLRIMGGRGT